MPLRHFVNLINKLNGLKGEEYEDAPQDNDFRQHIHPAGSSVSTNQLVRQHSLGQATLAGSALRERCAVAGYLMCTPVLRIRRHEQRTILGFSLQMPHQGRMPAKPAFSLPVCSQPSHRSSC